MSIGPVDAAARLAAIVASSDDAIVSKDLNGNITSWNHAAERMFGWTSDEAVGKSIKIIIPIDRDSEEEFVLSRIRQGLSVEHFETVRQRKDGSMIDISVTISPIHASDGAIIGASKIARDITEQRRLRQEADEASRLKDEFLATLSHELRTPLNTVVGYAAMMRKGTMPAVQQSKAIDVIHRNAQMLTHLVDELLDTSRIVTGKIRLDAQDTDLSMIAREAVENIRPSVEAKGLNLETHIQSDVRILGDRDRLRQVLWNLLSNAIKFTPSRGKIEIRVWREPPHALVAVRDSGIGVAAEALPHIFKRFWQAESGRIREYGGLGLGLALSRYLAELHGGTIEAKSEGTGKGAQFVVILPLRIADVARAG